MGHEHWLKKAGALLPFAGQQGHAAGELRYYDRSLLKLPTMTFRAAVPRGAPAMVRREPQRQNVVLIRLSSISAAMWTRHDGRTGEPSARAPRSGKRQSFRRRGHRRCRAVQANPVITGQRFVARAPRWSRADVGEQRDLDGVFLARAPASWIAPAADTYGRFGRTGAFPDLPSRTAVRRTCSDCKTVDAKTRGRPLNELRGGIKIRQRGNKMPR